MKFPWVRRESSWTRARDVSELPERGVVVKERKRCEGLDSWDRRPGCGSRRADLKWRVVLISGFERNELVKEGVWNNQEFHDKEADVGRSGGR